MTTILLAVAAGGAVVAVVLLVVLLMRPQGDARGEGEKILRDELRAGREEAAQAGTALRGEVAGQMKGATDTLLKQVGDLGKAQEGRLDKVRETLDQRLAALQESNEKKLDQMRRTVDEQLQTTLEKRLTESFKRVSDNLEAVQKGLGEMQTLATGVGDLKRVLTNVKARGTWGEVQLGALLEEVLAPDQFERNVATRDDSREMVEYAVRLPGRDGDAGSVVYLPIDAKFPQEDYLRLQEASERGGAEAVEAAAAALVRAVQTSAKDIAEKYLNPPKTTDFAILFLPTEGLYAEIVRRPGQVEELQRQYRVVVAGPTTLAALLNSLRMGFRTLAIEKRSSEVWQVLGAVKSEFGKFGEIIGKVRRQLELASSALEQTDVRTRAMERRLRNVEELPTDRARDLLRLPEAGGTDEYDDDVPQK
ncbi:MAG TPA: DNA recombination protein RmuC [Candidatus Polarisedimenticolia bacterium]|nr:DNA recombination protein RmuC [Candidatus Polarisedimenticolia bacterium]